MRRARLLALPFTLAALAVGLAACGDDSTASSATSAAGATTAAGAATSAGAAAAAGLPTVTGAFGQKPTITLPSTPPPSTLQVQVLQQGTGPKVAKGDNLTANYVGITWPGGKQFDSSFDRGQPATFPVGVGQLIKGWDETLPGLNYGSRVLVVVPPDKGYGAGGNPAAGIQGTDSLVFVVDLVEKAAG